ncbi:MAG: helix-turn-helix domain-containing protein [Thermoanaerobaculia bacterium]
MPYHRRMRVREFAVHPELRPFVRSVWSLETEAQASTILPIRIVPDGVVELVFHYRAPFAMRFADGSFEIQPRSFAVSQIRRFVEIRPQGRGGFLAARFEPWGAQQFLSMPIGDLADGLVTAEDLWGTEGRDVEEWLELAPDEEQRVAKLEAFLLARLHEHRKPDLQPLVREVWRRGGQVRVSEFCEQVGVGERSLERAFTKALGLPPKSYARLCRFLCACRDLTASATPSLTEIGHARGYYDQAHFIGDFRAYSGMTPGEFRARGDVSFFELD